MPTIADILGGLKAAEVEQDSTLVQMAQVMECGVDQVKRLIAENGGGMIYSRGLIVEDTPRHRTKLSEMYGKIVILTVDGVVYIRTHGTTIKARKRQRDKQMEIERRRIKREIEQRRLERETLRMFREGQTHPSPKRQGRANSHADIGQFVSRKRQELLALKAAERVYTRTKYREVSINYNVLH